MINKLMKRSKNNKGFTLIELIVVIAILGILAAILIPQFAGFQDKARSAQVTVDAKQIATAADALFAEDHLLPTVDEIKTMSGVAVTATNLTDLALTGTGTPVVFKFTESVDTISFTATRTATGDINVAKN